MSLDAGLGRLFRAPTFDDVEKTERARMLVSVAIGSAVLVTLVNGLSVLAAPGLAARLITLAVAYGLVSLGVIAAARAGWVYPASTAWIIAVWLIATWTAWTGGGLAAPAVSLQFLIVVLAGLLLGWQATVVAAAAAVVVMLGLGYAQITGSLPPAEPRPPMFRAITLAGYVTVLALLSVVALRSRERLAATLSTERERRERQERLSEKDATIRRAYADVIKVVTGGRLLLSTAEENRQALGDPLGEERSVASGGLGEEIAHIRRLVSEEFPAMADVTRLVDPAGEALTNAVKHAGGGVYQVYRRGDIAQIRVTDSGPGSTSSTCRELPSSPATRPWGPSATDLT